MTVLTNAVKTVATDRAVTIGTKRAIACTLSFCTAAATWTHFYADGGVNRYCQSHAPAYGSGAYAKANHSLVVVDETVELKTVKAAF
jgi:hypothetical protein